MTADSARIEISPHGGIPLRSSRSYTLVRYGQDGLVSVFKKNSPPRGSVVVRSIGVLRVSAIFPIFSPGGVIP